MRRHLDEAEPLKLKGSAPRAFRRLAEMGVCVFRWRGGRGLLVGLFAALLGGCSGEQSSLDPAGHEGERIATLFWWMVGGTAMIWGAVMALAFYCVRADPHEGEGAHQSSRSKWLIVGCGAVVPTVVLAVLLIYGLAMLPDLLARAPEGSLRIAVTGEQWWWRVHYQPPASGEGAGSGDVVLANEIVLPVGEPVEFILDSPDVIHAFWIPPIGGKMDMIPGRKTRLTLRPTRTGVFRGVCAEYCGTAHALMAFAVVVMEKEDFAQWLEHQRQPARTPSEPLAMRGRELFQANGCAACHAVRGTGAAGFVGPDLTHVGSRRTLGAGILPNDIAAFERWLRETNHVKPGVRMPHFSMLPPDDLRALATYLESLQ